MINTDAEGRLILADALTYAQQLGCTHLVDAATLTGAIVVALGHINVGVFANDDALRDRVLAAARAEGEKMWHMPLDDDYKDYLKSAFADLPNVGGRWGGAITAAMFLKEFADETPWVHLDIAGTAWLDDAKPYLAKGPTGCRCGRWSGWRWTGRTGSKGAAPGRKIARLPFTLDLSCVFACVFACMFARGCRGVGIRPRLPGLPRHLTRPGQVRHSLYRPPACA